MGKERGGGREGEKAGRSRHLQPISLGQAGEEEGWEEGRRAWTKQTLLLHVSLITIHTPSSSGNALSFSIRPWTPLHRPGNSSVHLNWAGGRRRHLPVLFSEKKCSRRRRRRREGHLSWAVGASSCPCLSMPA